MSNMCVIGAGRMGSLYGALLAKNGLQVMLYDPWRQEGRPTEVDALNGAVVGEGQKFGIDTPYNHATTLMIKAPGAICAMPQVKPR